MNKTNLSQVWFKPKTGVAQKIDSKPYLWVKFSLAKIEIFIGLKCAKPRPKQENWTFNLENPPKKTKPLMEQW